MSEDLFDDGYDPADDMDGPGLFDEPVIQEGPGLFDVPEDEPETPAADDGPVREAPASPRPERMVDDAPAAPLALYRRYRPDTFAEVIGQEHVTDPLQRALANNRVNHAYLFSGPRGCGKTTSARILARCLNCEQGPTPTPCGECQSCRDLATGGPGSIDVIEIDAASHGRVEDARDLRERAYFAPVSSRYKIYIVDEAHQVTRDGFNALLKIVEEPPPHVKFIFATTEPEKVMGTIRSRTHHYPFRLVPPKVLQHYLGELCEREGVVIEPTVLPLVVRAGAGSVRDSLSVLDQLLGSATEEGVTYSHAAALLGFTPENLLDEIVDAFAAGDGSGVFQAVDHVIENGQDPRRFAEDLLTRLRDLVVVASVPDAISEGLVDVAEDQAERLVTQAAGMGVGELTRAAEVIATGLTQMRGTTAPRLHLELMCSRVLLPGADVDERGLHARVDRLERRMEMAPLSGMPVPVEAPESTPLVQPSRAAVPSTDAGEGASAGLETFSQQRPASRPAPVAEPGRAPAVEPPAASVAEPAEATSRQHKSTVTSPLPPRLAPPAPVPEPQPGSAPDPQPVPVAEPVEATTRQPEPAASQPARGNGMTVAQMRQVWPQVLEAVQRRRRFTWIMLSQNAQVVDVDHGALILAMVNEGARESWARGGNDDVLREALVAELGIDLKIETILDGSAPASRGRQSGAPAAPRREEPRPPQAPSAPLHDDRPPAPEPEPEPPADEDEGSMDDPDVDLGPESGEELLRATLGAVRIEEN